MLNITELKAFIPTLNLVEAKSFNSSLLGLNLVSEDNFALEFDFNGSKIRVTKVQDFKPQVFTILGWNVKDIESNPGRGLEDSPIKLSGHNLYQKYCY